jgi:hypothetical protein
MGQRGQRQLTTTERVCRPEWVLDLFFPLSLPRLLPDLTEYMSITTGVL